MLTTSLTPAQAGTARVAAAYHQLAHIEARFRGLKGFLLTANSRRADLTTRRSPLQARTLTAVGTSRWDKATIT